MKRIILAILAFLPLTISFDVRAQSEVRWNASLYGQASIEGRMPFWAVTNRNGLFPESSGGILVGGADVFYRTKPQIDITSGISLAGAVTPGLCKGMVDKLYFGIGWKFLHLDLGMKDREQDFHGLSLTGGDIVYTGNARNLPGYNLHTDFIVIPGTKETLALKANFADYAMTDNRYVKNTLLHNQSFFAKFKLYKGLHLTIGLELWSQWAGISPHQGVQPAGFKNYMRILFGMSGGADATQSDQINALGNHLGRELIRLDWQTDKFTLSVQHDIPFDDSSGMLMQNFPDGVNTLHFSFNDRQKWVSDILFEFTYTKWQSGPRHDNSDEVAKDPENVKFKILGGCDNYFNNGTYRSGWTYHGRTIGLPLFTPVPVNEEGQTLGVCNNRVVAWHLGLAGAIARKVPYKLMMTYSRNYGRYHQPAGFFDSAPDQFSMALEGEWPRISRSLPVSVGLGIYSDIGRLYPNSFGLTLRLTYKDFHKLKQNLK